MWEKWFCWWIHDAFVTISVQWLQESLPKGDQLVQSLTVLPQTTHHTAAAEKTFALIWLPKSPFIHLQVKCSHYISHVFLMPSFDIINKNLSIANFVLFQKGNDLDIFWTKQVGIMILMNHKLELPKSVLPKQFFGKSYTGCCAVAFAAVIRGGIWNLFMVLMTAHLP